MKKLLIISVIFMITAFLCIKAQNIQPALNQAELMKKFIGTWQSGNGRDTILTWEMKEFNNALMQIYWTTINGVARAQSICYVTYDPACDHFKCCSLWPNGQVRTLLAKFASEREVNFDRADDLKADVFLSRNTTIFEDNDHFTISNYNSDRVKTGTSRWVRTSSGASVSKSAYGPNPGSAVDQVKALDQFIGTWEGKTGEETTQVWEFIRNGKSLHANTYTVRQNVKTSTNILCYGFDPRENKFKGYSLSATTGSYSTWFLTFVSENMCRVEMKTDLNPETTGNMFDCIFDDKDTWRMIGYKEGVKTSESKFVRIK